MQRSVVEVAQPTAVDLFAGGGGLTVGLKAAGFRVVSAVELEPHAYATYKANHPEVFAYKQDIRTVDGASLESHAEDRIDLLAGCPPCQGFTSLTSKWRRDDPRNLLVREMARLVAAMLPRSVMMENVPGLAGAGSHLLHEFVDALEALGYRVTLDVLQVAHYGTPQMRRRLVLFAGHGFEIPLPKPTHGKHAGNAPLRAIQDAIGGLPCPATFSPRAVRPGLPISGWHVVRTLSPENRDRIRHAKPGGNWKDIPEQLRPPCHRGSYNGFSNVYGRMTWGEPSPTITAGCTTISKGRFGHPHEDRTISLYEAALLQEFPPDYILSTEYMERACEIVGNALPCGFAMQMARSVKAALDLTPDELAGERYRLHAGSQAAQEAVGRREGVGGEGQG